MVKSKLKIALDRFQQRDFEAEKDKKLRKKASKIQKAKKLEEEEESEEEEEEIPELIDASTKLPEKEAVEEAEEEEEDEEKDEEEEEEDEEEDDLAFSDVDSDEDLQDATPYTRLTINNKAALLNSLSKIALPFTTLPFSAHLSLTSTEPTEILDINDDLNRELAFYTQALAHARQARDILASEPNATPFSRPNDYFAEMVKSDEHMGKIKQKLLDEAADKKASADARKQRDLRKFGKKVQVEKLQERQKAKTETLGKIQALKRKRASGDTEFTTNEPDMFDVALDNSLAPDGKRKQSTPASASKRHKKNEKFGFGGKAKHNKRNDSESAGDVGGFSARANKARQFGNAKKSGGAKKRLGKSVRKAKK